MSLVLAIITLILGGLIFVAQYGDTEPNDRHVRRLKRVLPTKLSFSRLQLLSGLSIAAVSLVFQVVTAIENEQKDRDAHPAGQRDRPTPRKPRADTAGNPNYQRAGQRLVDLQVEAPASQPMDGRREFRPDDNSKMVLASLLPRHARNPSTAELLNKDGTVETVRSHGCSRGPPI